jgi:hypothetical protein
VAFDRDVLRLTAGHHQMDELADERARQGWSTLKDFLEDLDDQRQRIGNVMPRLARAMDRLEAALGSDFDQANPIAIGTHGQRVIRLAEQAGEALMDEDAADVQEFAAALGLFLDRFPDWIAYKADADAHPPDPAQIEDLLPAARTLIEAARDDDVVSDDVADALEDQRSNAEDDPTDPIAARGLRMSLRNVLNALGEQALAGLRVVKRETGDVVGRTWEETKKVFSSLAGKSIGMAAVASASFLVAEATGLMALATKAASDFGWLAAVLRALGVTV